MKQVKKQFQNGRLSCLLLMAALSLGHSSCKKFLDAKANQSLSIPTGLNDLQGLMNNNTIMNTSYPSGAEMSSDNFYLADASWLALTNLTAKNLYTWDPETTNLGDWTSPYRVVSLSNIVLEQVDKITVNAAETTLRDQVKGTALFFRSYAFYHLATNFMQVWDSLKADQLPGLPLRLEPEITSLSVRATMRETVERIISDMESAVNLLPLQVTFKTQPSRAAGWGHIARVYLYLQQYRKAERAADSSLALYSTLLNYNSADTLASIPFKIMNDEVIFHTRITGGSSLSNSLTIVDSNLYRMYEATDLRKKLFFASRAAGGYSFKGSYLGELTPLAFNGLTVSELLLVKAETATRNGNISQALSALNQLLQNRYRKNAFLPVTVQQPGLLLELVLNERRKELVFRGQRWADLKRLNAEGKQQVTLYRKIEGKWYELKPNDLRYTFLIPADVIKFSGMPQNAR